MAERFSRPSRGEAKHIRRQKAAERRADTSAVDPQRVIEKSLNNQQRLTEIETRLTGIDPEGNPQLAAQLHVRRFWLKFALGQITRAENQSLQARFLNDLGERDPVTLTWLEEVISTEVGRDRVSRPVTRLIQIRREIMGPD